MTGSMQKVWSLKGIQIQQLVCFPILLEIMEAWWMKELGPQIGKMEKNWETLGLPEIASHMEGISLL